MAMAASIPPGGVFELICSKSENLRPCREDPSDGRKTCLFDMPRLPNQLEPPYLGRCFRPTLSCPPVSHRQREQRGSGRPVDNNQISHGTVLPQRDHFLVRG